MTDAVVLYYDEFHTPRELVAALADPLVLDVELGAGAAVPESSGFRLRTVDARDRFCEEYLLRAVKANAVYAGGYTLSAALARPLLAEICAEVVEEERARTLVHGFAGNDQLRFEMAMRVLAPGVEVTSTARLLGSQNRRNGDGTTTSENLWGRTVEAGPLADPAVPPPPELLAAGESAPALHTVRFEEGRPVALDGEEFALPELVARLDAIGRPRGVGVCDLVEDGFVGLKTRAVYDAPAATSLIVAHRDLEAFVSSRRQNDFKAAVDAAWAALVYDGLWFDPQRQSLDAYVDDVNRWVNGEVDLLFRPGGVRAVARRSACALYDERSAVYRVGQDFAVDGVAAVAELLALPMQAAARRRQPREEAAWSA